MYFYHFLVVTNPSLYYRVLNQNEFNEGPDSQDEFVPQVLVPRLNILSLLIAAENLNYISEFLSIVPRLEHIRSCNKSEA